MTRADDRETVVLDTLKQAVAQALERKRRLGQYAVVWRDGRVMCIGPDAPVVRNPSGTEAALATGGVVERGRDD